MRQDFHVFGAVFLLGHMFHQDDDALDARHQIHGAAHALDHLAWDHPVGQITFLAHLHGTENAEVDLAATDHGKAVVAAENAGALDGGDGLLASVDQVGVDFIGRRERTDTQHAVFRLQPDFLSGWHVVGHQGRDADTQVHIKTVFQFLRSTRRHLVLCPGHDQTPAFSVMVRFSMRFSGFALSTMRCT